MKVTLLLADHAQVVGGKLFLMGGGWSLIGPRPTPFAIAGKIEVPWTESNRKHAVKFELVDGDGKSVSIPTANGQAPIQISGEFEVGRPAGLMQGVPLDLPFAFNIGPILLAPGKRFVWKMTINGETHSDWQVAFSTRPSTKNPAAV